MIVVFHAIVIIVMASFVAVNCITSTIVVGLSTRRWQPCRASEHATIMALYDCYSFAPCTGCLAVHLVFFVSLATMTKPSSAGLVCWASWHLTSAVSLHQQQAGRYACMQRHIHLSSPLLTPSHLTLSQLYLRFRVTKPFASTRFTSPHLTSSCLTSPRLNSHHTSPCLTSYQTASPCLTSL